MGVDIADFAAFWDGAHGQTHRALPALTGRCHHVGTIGRCAEACDFRDRIKAFESEKTVVLGVSGDTLESHAKFRAKYKLPFPLLTDPDYKISTLYGAFGDKKLYGKSLKGVYGAAPARELKRALEGEYSGPDIMQETGRYLEVRMRHHINQAANRHKSSYNL